MPSIENCFLLTNNVYQGKQDVVNNNVDWGEQDAIKIM